MIFTLNTTTVTLDSPAQYPLTNNTELIQAKDKSASGITHVESFEVRSNLLSYTFNDVSDADYIKIIEWFVNTVDGMLLTFSLTDDLGVTRIVRFTEPKLNFVKNSFGLWSGSFQVEEII
jgi:hypothetical protein